MLKIKYSFADEDALKDYVSEIYGLPIRVFELQRDQRGALYYVYTQQKKYVFKLSHTYYKEKSVNAVNMIDYLRKRNFPAVEIIPTAKDELYISVPMPEGIRIGVLYGFIEGRAATFDDMEEIGKTAALLHNEMSSFNGIMPRLYDKCYVIDELPKTLRMIRFDETKIIDIERTANVIWDRIKDFPSAIVHGDFDKNNIIIKDDGTITMFDFDDAGYMPLIYDVVYTCNRIGLREFTREDAELTEKTIAMYLKGYRSVNPHAEFATSDAFNWIGYRRLDVQMIILRFEHSKSGLIPFERLDMLHQWLADWEKYTVIMT